MPAYIKRKQYFSITRFQWPILKVSIVPTFIICVSLTAFVVYFHGELIDALHYHSAVKTIKVINQWGLTILIAIWVAFVTICVWAQTTSSNLVGAFERIFRELDEIIEGKKFHEIKARDNDVLVNELLIRVNKMIHIMKRPPGGPDHDKSIGRF